MLWMLPFKRYLQFSGRSGRAEYWQYIAVVFGLWAVALLLDVGSARSPVNGTATLSMLILIVTAIPTYAVTFRRLHDRNRSGWLVGVMWVLNGAYAASLRMRTMLEGSIIAAPFVLIDAVLLFATALLAIYLLVQVCSPGDGGDNRFGPPSAAQDAIAQAQLRTSIETMRQRANNPSSKPAEADPLDQIARLSALHQQGSLTDAEYETQKAALLARLQR